MSPQAPSALEHKVDGREVGCDQIEVQIQTLFHYLGRDEDFSASSITPLPKGL
jgi:hypothetical protein